MSADEINYQERLERLGELCRTSSAQLSELESVIQELNRAGYQADVSSTLESNLANPSAPPVLGALWVQSATSRHKWGLSEELNKLMGRGEIGRQALIAYALALGTSGRGRSLRALIHDHGDWLRESDEGWNNVAAALGLTKQWWRLLRWTSDWRKHEQASQVALFYRVVSLRRIGWIRSADTVARSALSRPRSDEHIYNQLLIWTATQDAFARRTAAAVETLGKVESHRLREPEMRSYRLARSVVELQSTPRGERYEVLDHGLKRMAKAFHKFPLWRKDWATQRDFCRALWRMTIDGRSLRPMVWGYWRFYGRVLLSALGILLGLLLLPFLGLMILYMPCCFIIIALIAYMAVRQRHG